MRYGGPSDGTAVASAAAATTVGVTVTVAAFTARSMLTRTSDGKLVNRHFELNVINL